MRNHCAVLPVYEDGEGCGLGTLWQEICKFTAHREKGFGAELGVSHCSRHSWRERPRNQAKASLQSRTWCMLEKKGGRKLSGMSKGSISPAPMAWHTLKSRETKALQTELGMGAHLGQDAEERLRRGADVWTCLENTTELFGMQMACQRERQHR